MTFFLIFAIFPVTSTELNRVGIHGKKKKECMCLYVNSVGYREAKYTQLVQQHVLSSHYQVLMDRKGGGMSFIFYKLAVSQGPQQVYMRRQHGQYEPSVMKVTKPKEPLEVGRRNSLIYFG